VAESATGIAGLARAGSTSVSALLAAKATTESTLRATGLVAVARDVSDFAAAVAFLGAATSSSAAAAHVVASSRTRLNTLAREMAGLTATVAGLLLLGCGAFARDVTLLTAVVAFLSTLGWAIAGLVGSVAA